MAWSWPTLPTSTVLISASFISKALKTPGFDPKIFRMSTALDLLCLSSGLHKKLFRLCQDTLLPPHLDMSLIWDDFVQFLTLLRLEQVWDDEQNLNSWPCHIAFQPWQIAIKIHKLTRCNAWQGGHRNPDSMPWSIRKLFILLASNTDCRREKG